MLSTNQWRKTHVKLFKNKQRFVISAIIMVYLRHGQKDIDKGLRKFRCRGTSGVLEAGGIFRKFGKCWIWGIVNSFAYWSFYLNTVNSHADLLMRVDFVFPEWNNKCHRQPVFPSYELTELLTRLHPITVILLK